MYKTPTQLLTLLLLLLLLTSLFALTSAAPPGLDAVLSDQFRLDPRATNDTYLSLSSHLKRFLSHPPFPSNPISHLLSLSVPIPVSVRLVGPAFSSSSPSLLSSFATAAISSSPFFSLSSPHNLAVSHNLHLSVSASSSHLSTSLSEALSKHLSTTPAPFHQTVLSSVPYSVIDSIIESDFQSEDSASSSPSFYIYLLNLGPQLRQYAYNFDGSDSSLAFSKCFGTVWAGKDRYMWIDLAAGPVNYGPALSGEGLLPKGEFHPLATLHGRPKSERSLHADLASLVLSAYKTMLVPSLRIPVYYENKLQIRFVHIYGSEQRDPVGLDWEVIEKAIEGGKLAYNYQNLEFKRYSIKYTECSLCSFAIARSTNSFTSRFLFENYTLIVSEYLDSKRLRQILSDSSEEMNRLAGIGEDEYSRIIPVFVFDLNWDKLLMLDRYHQAVAFKDMVVAVRTKSSQTVSDYSCNGRHVITQTRNLNRPLVGAILQSMWGVSPTHLSWSPEHNDTLIDYTWSVGHTPFGPFAETLTLSFAQRDAARRNVILSTLNYTISSAIDVLEAMAMHGGEKMLHRKKRYVEFVQRWNLFRFKLDKVVSTMSRLDYEKAMYYLKLSDHDLYMIHTLVYQASQEMEAQLVCFTDPPFPWITVSVSATFVFGFFYVYAKRDKLFRNKRKQF
ncbi:hypothetical protein LUZ61_015719 [Rhynchospora tenuis]|uniref:DUF7906 domain-containing protein n=1 Tax=Rhynchospora tenuis TaxID=198213 RepID=A0AAD5Z470_9POAL|nr:hypothetical protein LUZ61_015719 [Rhynchospora tenuis]